MTAASVKPEAAEIYNLHKVVIPTLSDESRHFVDWKIHFKVLLLCSMNFLIFLTDFLCLQILVLCSIQQFFFLLGFF